MQAGKKIGAQRNVRRKCKRLRSSFHTNGFCPGRFIIRLGNNKPVDFTLRQSCSLLPPFHVSQNLTPCLASLSASKSYSKSEGKKRLQSTIAVLSASAARSS